MAELIFAAIKTGSDGLPWMYNPGNLIAAEEILTESEVLQHVAHSVSLNRPDTFHIESFGEI